MRANIVGSAMAELSVTTLAGLIGLVIGLLFGGITHRTNFCTMGAVADVVSFSDYGRARAWLLAIAVAIIGAQTVGVSRQQVGQWLFNRQCYERANHDLQPK